MTETVTPQQAQLARVAWVLKGGADAAGVIVSASTMQKLALAMNQFMQDEGIFFDYQRRVDEAAAAMERDAT